MTCPFYHLRMIVALRCFCENQPLGETQTSQINQFTSTKTSARLTQVVSQKKKSCRNYSNYTLYMLPLACHTQHLKASVCNFKKCFYPYNIHLISKIPQKNCHLQYFHAMDLLSFFVFVYQFAFLLSGSCLHFSSPEMSSALSCNRAAQVYPPFFP